MPTCTNQLLCIVSKKAPLLSFDVSPESKCCQLLSCLDSLLKAQKASGESGGIVLIRTSASNGAFSLLFELLCSKPLRRCEALVQRSIEVCAPPAHEARLATVRMPIFVLALCNLFVLGVHKLLQLRAPATSEHVSKNFTKGTAEDRTSTVSSSKSSF